VALLLPGIDPDLVVVAGGVALAAGELLLQPARAELAARHPLAAVLDPPPIILGRAGPNAAAHGAADLARLALEPSRRPAPPRLHPRPNRTD
jgi:glucokinase